jgi:zinc transporter, ZIP family
MDSVPIVASAITAFIATMSAGILIRKFKKNFGIVCAFASGAMLGLVAFDMAPDVTSLIPQTELSLAFPIFSAVLGFVFLYSLIGFFRKRKSAEGKRKVGWISTAEFCSHGFLEGLAIGFGFQFQFGLGLAVAFTVVSHDFCDGLSTIALMLNAGNSVKSSLGMLFVDAIAPFLGALLTLVFVLPEAFFLLTLSFLAGGFVYIGGFSLLPEAYMMNRPRTTLVLFILGFAVIFLFSNRFF